eukprot:CAMPEP_0118930742 /NCGR_PEP_ID=MMETSP1169-20130426/7326_1 /TAXON_ID=36882 /ORGANISM="Pyramimonas obovata, Strain CCMP722" /LENGTH=129 /DNA_ID=CAMNT_0006873145 /DNA_START=26 /DNA_END=412 /DNA_ORIENTATION=+
MSSAPPTSEPASPVLGAAEGGALDEETSVQDDDSPSPPRRETARAATSEAFRMTSDPSPSEPASPRLGATEGALDEDEETSIQDDDSPSTPRQETSRARPAWERVALFSPIPKRYVLDDDPNPADESAY